MVRVLPSWTPPTFPIHALMIPGRYRPAKISAALQMLRDKVPQLPGVVA